MQLAATSSSIDNESSVPSDVTDPALEIIDLLLFLHHLTAVPCQKKCCRMKAVLCNESGLPSLHGFAATRIETAIVDAVCGPRKTIGCQQKILTEYVKADEQRRLMVGKIIVKEKVHYVLIIVLHGIKQRPMHYKYVCMANFRTLIAILKYHRCFCNATKSASIIFLLKKNCSSF